MKMKNGKWKCLLFFRPPLFQKYYKSSRRRHAVLKWRTSTCYYLESGRSLNFFPLPQYFILLTFNIEIVNVNSGENSCISYISICQSTLNDFSQCILSSVHLSDSIDSPLRNTEAACRCCKRNCKVLKKEPGVYFLYVCKDCTWSICWYECWNKANYVYCMCPFITHWV